MDQPPTEPGSPTRSINTQVIVALIGASATILAALLAGYFSLVNRNNQTPVLTNTPNVLLTVDIDGPMTAPLDQLTYFTIISSNASRALWSIGGFNNNETTEVEPLAPSYQIQIEPTDAARIGDSFTLVVTVFDRAGGSVTASHEFEVVDGE